VRYLAYELAPQGIRIHALSAGPLRTRAASGIGHFDRLVEDAAQRTPMRQLVTIEDVGKAAAFLISDEARSLTVDTIFVDGGRHILG
jgi:enoyl-[acyl-carrier protein] reductase I